LKNSTASKTGYETEWILLSIDENTTYDFVLTPSAGNTLYVGGSGPGNYTTIQSAINDAVDGDTVFVYDDSAPYNENIVVVKSINLIGEDRNTTVIDANNNGDVIFVSAEHVSISGFTIQNSGISEYPFYEHQGIDINSNENTITGNIIYHTERAISLNFSNGNIIRDNIIDNCSCHGIYQYDSHYNDISYNVISNCNYSGICLAVSDNNILSHNTIKTVIYGHGIILSISNNNSIEENSLINNKYGMVIRQGENNSIIRNNFQENSRRNAYFYALLIGSNNKWDENYWGQARTLPKLIFGTIFFERRKIWLHWINFDWNPSQEPYLEKSSDE